MKFAEVVEENELATHGTIYVVHVDPGLLAELEYANTTVRRLARGEDEGHATQLAELLRFARFRIVSSILPLDEPVLELLRIAEGIDAIRNQLPEGSELHHEADRSCVALLDLMQSSTNPLGVAAMELLSDLPEGDRILALARNHYCESTRQYLSDVGIPGRVLHGTSLHTLGPVETIVCIGSPVSGFFPASTWSTPKADSTCFVHYPLGWSPPSFEGLFGFGTALATPRVVESGATDSTLDVEPFDFGESGMEALARAARKPVDGWGEEIEAFLIALSGGYAVWTETDLRNEMLCVDVDNPSHPVIVKKSARSLQPGDFVVLRTGGADPDFIRSLADTQFGASSERPMQEHWKSCLREAVSRAGGVDIAVTRLEGFGVRTSNIHYWMGTKCISPQKESDLRGVCRFAGIEDEADSLCKSMSNIRRAHIKAGQFVRKELEQCLLDGGSQQLIDLGFQEYELEHAGQLAAFQICFLSGEKRMIASSVIDRPFVAEEAGWPG